VNFPNYIPTVNPFGLATPPDWFLRELLAYDPRLVIFPSTCKPVYQMGRRANRGQGMARPLEHLPDTKVFFDHRIWPWKEVLGTALMGMSWARVLRDLPCYDTTKVDDPTRAPDRLEEAEEAELNARIADGADQLAKDFWGTYHLIEGSRVGYGNAARRLPPNNKARGNRRRVHRPSAPSGTGAIWVGR